MTDKNVHTFFAAVPVCLYYRVGTNLFQMVEMTFCLHSFSGLYGDNGLMPARLVMDKGKVKFSIESVQMEIAFLAYLYSLHRSIIPCNFFSKSTDFLKKIVEVGGDESIISINLLDCQTSSTSSYDHS